MFKPDSQTTLHYGDCLEVMKSIPDGSVDMTKQTNKQDELSALKSKADKLAEALEHVLRCEIHPRKMHSIIKQALSEWKGQ